MNASIGSDTERAHNRMDCFRIGGVEVARIEEKIHYFDADEFYPDIRRDVLQEHASWLAPFFDIPGHRMPCVFQAFVVKYRGLTIVIDTCFGNDKERPDFLLGHQLQTPFLERLQAVGCKPEDVNLVMCTHMHVDHVGWNTRLADGRWVPTFPNATYVFSQEEYAQYLPENIRPESPPPFLFSYQDSVLPVIEAGQAQMVSGEHQVNEILTVLPTPGHTPGHVSIRVGDRDSTGLFIGDVIHNAVQIADPDLNSAYCEVPSLARQSRRQILDTAADTHALLVPGHFVAPHVGHVTRKDGRYRFVGSR
jgi:glyoxylase-like metal-dependent hydrolase (beta-lactamase superfamily II)